MQEMKKDGLTVKIFETREKMGNAAERDIAVCFRNLLQEKKEINVIFAAAPSQSDVLAALVADKSIEWNRIHAYHMDEYVGLNQDAPQLFGNFLRREIFSLVPFSSVDYINGGAEDAEAEAERYAKIIRNNPPDAVILGIGENGHIAFNDPPVADFNDPKTVKRVKLDETCRAQQVHDGCFASIGEVPQYALTLTVPALVQSPNLFCIVPCKTKAKAVKETLNGEISASCPASILRTRENAFLYLDRDSASLL